MPRDVVVITELDEHGAVADHTVELLDEAAAQRKVLGGRVVAVVLAAEEPADLSPLHAHGADEITIVVNPILGVADPRLWADAVGSVVAQLPAPLVLVAETAAGCGLAPRLAARLGAIYSAHTIRITAGPDEVLSIDHAVAGGTSSCAQEARPGTAVVASFAVGSLGVGKPVRGNTATVERTSYEVPDGLRPVELIELIAPDPQTVPIAEAQWVIAGGQGFRSKEGVELLWELGRELHMTVGGSKPTVDHGWIPRDRLIGVSSGRRLTPDLFIGVGVSGSSHFVAGMSQSRVVIAINTNPGAPLMKMADLAIEADLHDVIPALVERVREMEHSA
jgi:electron transfer flavoprotein alpha subunit